jgi:BlaI family transcriptional regulator, penicillinase repressor
VVLAMPLAGTLLRGTDCPEIEPALSRRERQFMDILFELGHGTGAEVRQRLPDSPSYSSVRTILRILERKGHVRHLQEGMRYVYVPVAEREAALRAAIQKLVNTWFKGSVAAAATTLLDLAAEEPLGQNRQNLSA